MDYDFYMNLALDEAKKAYLLGEVPVGTVIVKDGKVISASHNETEKHSDPLCHSEITALKRAFEICGKDLSGATVFVTMEPCPMCASAICLAKADGVVFGAYDERAGALGSRLSIFEIEFYKKMKVIGGIKEAECKKLLRDFFIERRNKNID